MFNVRYHIASLVAVFLALALGLVLGGLVVQRGTLDGQQDALVDGLREEFDDLRTENRELTAENRILSAFTADAVAQSIDGRLEGKTVMVLVNGGKEQGLRPAQQAITDAGGTPAVVTMLQPGFGLEDAELRSRVTSLTGSLDDPVASVTASLAAEWTAAGPRPVTDLLVDAGVISVAELPAGTVVSGVVDISSPDGESDPAALSLAVRMHASGIPAVGAQAVGADTGKAAAAAEAGIGGLDGLGSEVAGYSLIALLTGAEPALYGPTGAAQAPYPPFAER